MNLKNDTARRDWSLAALATLVLVVTLLVGGDSRADERARASAAKVAKARNADRLGGKTLRQLTENCPKDSVNVGTYCIMRLPYPVLEEDVGKNNFFWASKKCASLGGWLPSASELVGAADQIALASTIDDSSAAASVDGDPTDGLKDRREMTSTLVTTAAGSSAAGSQGVTTGSKGNPRVGEPDPVPLPANPQPETLQYVTVYDNKDQGGFAGSRPVSQAENFRCASNKIDARKQRKAVG